MYLALRKRETEREEKRSVFVFVCLFVFLVFIRIYWILATTFDSISSIISHLIFDPSYISSIPYTKYLSYFMFKIILTFLDLLKN